MKYVAEGRWLHIETESLFVKTIQEFFDNYIPSRKIQHLLIQNKHILMDGNPVKREDDIAGLRLSICIYPEECFFEKASLSPDIVYEDEIMAIVNKPKDLLVHSDGNGEMTLTRIMQSYYSDRDDIDPLPIHRLDRETSGLVIYSKSPVFHPLTEGAPDFMAGLSFPCPDGRRFKMPCFELSDALVFAAFTIITSQVFIRRCGCGDP